MHKIVLAVDFDDTMAEVAYPDLGAPKPHLSEVFKRLIADFHIIIWTCREGIDVDRIRAWCFQHDIPYDQINEHHPTILAHYKNDTRKVCADIYIDDRCLFTLPNDWLDIEQLIKQRASDLHDHKKCLNIKL